MGLGLAPVWFRAALGHFSRIVPRRTRVLRARRQLQHLDRNVVERRRGFGNLGFYLRNRRGHFKRIISDPKWLKDFFDPRRVGGPLVDLHVHDAHLIRMLFGMPTAVVSQGRMRGEVVEFCNTLFHFADPSLVVSASSGVINQQGRGFTHAFEIHLEKATLLYDLAYFAGEPQPRVSPLTILDHKGQAIVPKLVAGDSVTAFEAEIAEVVKSIRTGRPSPILSGELARDAVVLCHKQTESVKQDRLVKV